MMKSFRGRGVMYHHDRAIAEQLRGSLEIKRRTEKIYEDMIDKWSTQEPSINFTKKRRRGPHNRALKRK